MAKCRCLRSVYQRDPGGIAKNNFLRLSVESVSLVPLRACSRSDQNVMQLFTAVKCNVARRFFRRSLVEQYIEKVVGVAVVAGPTELGHSVFTLGNFVQIRSPFPLHDFGANANFF